MNYFNQESERLIYRALTENDIDSWTEFFENNDKLAFLGIDLSRDSKTIATEWIMKQLERYKTQGLGHLASIKKSTGEFIGMTGILLREINGKDEYEIAYSLKPKFWNNGYATEMAKQMKLFGQQNNIATSFISIIDKNNIASINVAKKNNMTIISDTEFSGMNVYIYGDN
jgi:ribosomal-protein-alanine N-acetyltransferase